MYSYKTRINVECLKKDKDCAWRLHASRMTHNSRFAFKIHNPVHTCGRDMGTDGHRRASRKWVASIVQNILKHRPTYRACDARKDFKDPHGVTLKYDNVWWGKELAQDALYELARCSYDSQ